MEITWLGHSSFRLRGKHVTVVTDPYDSVSTGMVLPRVIADIVTISHDHGDHNNQKGVEGDPKVVSGPGEYEIADVSLFGIPSYHDDKHGAERGGNTIYTITIDDIHLCHLGDLGHRLSETQIGEIGAIDILFVPVGGFFTIGPSEASDVVSDLEPKIVIPMHYKTSQIGPGFEKLSDVSDFIAEMGVEPKREAKLEVTFDKLPTEREIIVLEKWQQISR